MVRGVHYNLTNRRWRASLRGQGARGYIGEFETEGEAIAARLAAERRLFGAECGTHEPIFGDVILLPLLDRRGFLRDYAIIDRDDASLAQPQWCLSAQGYVVRRDGETIIFLHRLIEPRGPAADHEDGDKRNCRRSNLRPATQLQNSRNRGFTAGRRMFKGVRRTPSGRFSARIMVDRQAIFLGTFDAPEAAALAYDAAARSHFGEFARTNL